MRQQKNPPSPWKWLSIIVAPIASILFAVVVMRFQRQRQHQSHNTTAFRQYVRGTSNNTVLFAIADHHGLSNVHLATVQSLIERHPEIQIHIACHPTIANKVSRLSDLVIVRQPLAKAVIFHPLHGCRTYVEALYSGYQKLHPSTKNDDGDMDMIIPPGLAGISKFVQLIPAVLAPWNITEHLSYHNQVLTLIDQISPATIVIDNAFLPGLEAARTRNWSHIILTPNTAAEAFITRQPRGGMFWKYPAIGSGFPYPVPWNLIPINIYLVFRVLLSVIQFDKGNVRRNFLRENGVADPLNLIDRYRPDVPWITMTTLEASIPLDVIPPNVTCTGPIVLSPALAEELDPQLYAWMKQKPTILINLGSAYTYSIKATNEAIGAVQRVLQNTDVQILWKYKITASVAEVFDWEKAMKPLVHTGRVHVSNWLTIDPPALLQSGLISLFVGHGGSNGYHEGIEAGVPMIIIPMWIDLYSFAQLTEQLGLGLWACRSVTPYFDAQCLSDAILKMLDGSPESKAMTTNIQAISAKVRGSPGRDIAADLIAKMAVL